MKKLILFLAMASTTMFVSCGSDDNGAAKATSIVLTASATTIDLGQPVTLSVKDNNGKDVTARATFFDGTTAVTSPYTPTTVGPHSLTAKLDNLTSPAVVVTVNAVAGSNSIFINGTNNSLDNSILALWGQNEDGTLLWSMLTFDAGADGGPLFDPTTRNHYIDVEFTTAADIPDFPTTAESTFNNIFEVFINGTEVTLAEITGGEITLGAWPSAINMPHAFEATANYGTSSLEVNFNKNWLGFYDDTAPAPEAKGLSKKFTAPKNLKKMSKAELADAKAKFFLNFKK